MGKHSPQSFKGVREVKMRIGWDCQPFFWAKTGIYWYWYYLLKELSKITREDSLFLFGFNPRGKRPELPPGLKERTNLHYLFPKSPPRTFILGLSRLSGGIFPGKLFPKLDLVHFPNFTSFPVGSAKIVLTVHDLIFKLFPDTVEKKVKTILELYLPSSLRMADLIIVNSHSTQKDLISFFPFVEEKTKIVYPGVDEIFQPITNTEKKEAILKKYRLEKYILFVGTIEPRKNLLTLIKAYEKMFQFLNSKSCPDLAIVGARGWKQSPLFKYFQGLPIEIQEKIHFLGFVPEEDLPVLYSSASVFVFPSLYEGFGLPVLEAMACGAPVVTANTSSLPEVGGEAVELVNPLDADEITAKIISLLDEKRASFLRGKGLIQAEKFSWTKAATQIYEIYGQLCL